MLKKKISGDGSKFLLGVDKDGYQYWLEKGTWECGWYWSFGYIRYGGNFSHFDTLFGKDEKDFACNFYDGFTARITESPLYQPGENNTNHKRLWEFCDLAKTIYTLKEAAEVLGRGGSHYIGDPLCKDIVKDEAYVKHLNEEVIPKLIKTAEGLLDPDVQ
jgi:hypothetical protein